MRTLKRSSKGRRPGSSLYHPTALAIEIERRRRLAIAKEKSEQQLEDLRGRLLGSYREFVIYFWDVLNDGHPLIIDRDFDAICEHMHAFYAPGSMRQIQYLIFQAQPGSAKTLLGIVFPNGWRWGHDKTWRFLSAAHAGIYEEHSQKTRALITHPKYQELWPLKIEQDSNKKSQWNIVGGGWRTAVNITGSFEGKGCDDAAADDLQCLKDRSNKKRCEDQWDAFSGTLMGRIRNKDVGGLAVIAQRLWGLDIYNRIRLEFPNMFDFFALEGRRTGLHSITYYKQLDDRIERVQLPMYDSALTRSGAYVDDREPGELASQRTTHEYLDNLPKSKYQALHQQAPILDSAQGAKLNAFDRKVHFKYFRDRMGCSTIQESIQKALNNGWKVSGGWDHGLDAQREIGGLIIWHDRLEEVWCLKGYANPKRQTPYEDAVGYRAHVLDFLEVSPRRVIKSRGDVGNMGKGTKGGAGGSINKALSMAIYRDGPRKGQKILGFPITAPSKGTIVEEVEILNDALGSGCFFVDAETAEPLAVAIENWDGSESYKDRIDAYRYPSMPHLKRWRNKRLGAYGVM